MIQMISMKWWWRRTNSVGYQAPVQTKLVDRSSHSLDNAIRIGSTKHLELNHQKLHRFIRNARFGARFGSNKFLRFCSRVTQYGLTCDHCECNASYEHYMAFIIWSMSFFHFAVLLFLMWYTIFNWLFAYATTVQIELSHVFTADES